MLKNTITHRSGPVVRGGRIVKYKGVAGSIAPGLGVVLLFMTGAVAAQTVLGTGATAGGGFTSVAIGSNAVGGDDPTDTGAIAIGDTAQATSDQTTAIGSASLASGSLATAVGHAAQATGDFSNAFGIGATASGVTSSAFGANTTVDADRKLTI